MSKSRSPLTLLLLAAAILFVPASRAHAQYTTDWAANTFGLDANHIGSVARSMWVAPEGVIYTSSLWDEDAGGVGIYQNGTTVGSIGVHNEFQGSAITGNATDLFVALSFNSSLGGSGLVGRYNRSSKTRDIILQVSADTTEQKADVITGLATSGTLLYVSDNPGNRVRVYMTDGTWKLDIGVASPGALAVDSAGNLWVAQKAAAAIQKFDPTGAPLTTITLASTARPASLFYDAGQQKLYVGDEGPDMNIKIFDISNNAPVLSSTFGTLGGYLDTTSGTKGYVGDKRFTRVHGIGRDSSGMLYVLNNPWGGTWDLGRDGGTDIHAYDPSGQLKWKLQSLNFEAVAAPDPATDGVYFFSGNNVYTGTAGGSFQYNTIDPFTYPNDPRINVADPQRGEDFGQIAYVNGHRILVANGQNPDIFYLHYFTNATGYIANPIGSIPGTLFNTTARIRNGFCIDSKGGIWAGLDKTNAIWHYPLTGFDSTGKPIWGAGVSTPTPASIGTLTRIIYLADTDTMILASGITGSTDWTAIGTRVEVYHGWFAGNTSSPNPVITLSSPNPKTIAAAGNYLFVGYVHTVPNIDAFNLTSGANEITFINSNPDNVSVGNDVDSMYGIRAYLRSTGEYVVTKDNYNSSNVVVYRWTPSN